MKSSLSLLSLIFVLLFSLPCAAQIAFMCNAGNNSVAGTFGCTGSASAGTTLIFDISASGVSGQMNGAQLATAWSLSSDVLTVTSTNSLTAGDSVMFENFVGAGSFLNGQTVTVLSSGLSGTQFSANFTHADASGTDLGVVISGYVPSGCGGGWRYVNAASAGTMSGGNWGVFILPNYAGGSCSPTINIPAYCGSHTCGLGISVTAATAPASDSIAFYRPFGQGTGGAAPSTLSFPIPEANTNVYISMHSTGSADTIGCPSGYTLTSGIPAGGAYSKLAFVCTLTGAPFSAPYSTQTVSTPSENGNAGQAFVMVLRSTAPTVGTVQQVECSFVLNSGVCPLPFPLAANDTGILTVPQFVGGNSWTLYDGLNLSHTLLPSWQTFSATYQIGEPGTVAEDVFYATGSPTAVLAVTVVRGLPASMAYIDGGANFNFSQLFGGTGPPTTWSSGPIHTLRPGTVYLYSTLGSLSNGGNSTYSPSSTCIPRLIDTAPAGTSFLSSCDAVVSVGSSTTFSNTYTFSPAMATAPAVGMWAFSVGTQYLDPHIVQTAHINASYPMSLPNALQNGNIVAACAIAGDGGCTGGWTATDSCGGTWTKQLGGGSSDTWALYTLSGYSSGPCTINVGNGCAHAGTQEEAEIYGVTSINGGNFQTATEVDSIGTGNVTTTNPTSLILSCGGAGYSLTNTLIQGDDPTYTNVDQGYADYASSFMFAKTVLEMGTWNNLITAPTETQIFMYGAIVPMSIYVPPSSFGHTILGNHASMGSQTKE